MATKKVGELIKEARTKAGLSQEALARQIEGLSASDISKAERGEKELSQAILKEIAKATGVTQKSLLDAAKGTTATTAAKKPATTTTAAKKTSSTTTAAKKTGTTTAKKTSSTTTAKKPATTAAAKKTDEGEKLTAAEKKLIELYRAADADTKKAAVALLKGEKTEDSGVLGSLLNMVGGSDIVNSLLGGLKK
ncbi:MAG: helix-turn-helix transcriptional regulator [Oscillospiraceae bacterium]|nr:helix-turn-helix transcriptional regulator [Oscillospiraceae bacterium]